MVLRKLSQSFRIAMALMVAMFSTGLLPTSFAYAHHETGHTGGAAGQDVCPDDTAAETFALTGGWDKTDGINALTWDIPEKAGYTVTDVCYKASNTLVYPDPITDPVTSTVWNKDGCPETNGCNYQNISHVSVYYTKNVSNPSSVVPAVFTAPTCEAPGTLIGTDTSEYTFVRTGADTAAVLTATPVGGVTLTGTTVFGPYDLTQLSGADCDYTPPTVTICPATLPTIHSTNKAPNGWTLPADAEYVEGGVQLNVSGDWDETYISRAMVGPLADIGSEVDFDADPNQYTGIHIVTDNGVLVYEKEGTYAGKWWSTSDFGVASGMGYATFDTLENIVAANPDVMTSELRVLYTSPTASSTVVTSVTVDCTDFTFDKEVTQVTVCPATLPTIYSTNKDKEGWTLPADAEYVDGGMKLNVSGDWDETYISRDMVGPLADIGSEVDFEASPEQYVGLHIVTDNGVLVYEKEGSYAGKWWSTSDFGVASGMGYATFDTLENIVAANPGVMTSELRVLYTSPTAGSTVVTSVTVDCTNFTFDKEEVIVEEKKTELCHATGSETNPYELIEVSVSGAYNGHLGDGNGDHQNGEDIIPPFMYDGEEYSQNWGPVGQAIYNNGCVVPSQTIEDMDYSIVCVQNGVKITFTNSTSVAGSVTVNGTSYVVPANGTKDVTLRYDLGTPFMTKVVVTVGTTTATQTVNCVPGGQGGGNVLGSQTGGGQGGGNVLGAATNAVLPAMLPSTGAKDSPFMILAAALLAYGAAYFLQGRRLLGRKEALSA